MNSFEQIVTMLFQASGYWAINGYRVELSKEEKKLVGKPSMPRPEIDVIAYQGKTNELLWVECKSYMDSGGVTYESFMNTKSSGYERYKVFNFPIYRDVISKAIIRQASRDGLTRDDPTLRYCLVAGNVRTEKDRTKLREYFSQEGWLFYDESWLVAQLHKAADTSYEDSATMMVAKLILRNQRT